MRIKAKANEEVLCLMCDEPAPTALTPQSEDRLAENDHSVKAVLPAAKLPIPEHSPKPKDDSESDDENEEHRNFGDTHKSVGALQSSSSTLPEDLAIPPRKCRTMRK